MIRSRVVSPVDWFSVFSDLVRCGVPIRRAATVLDIEFFRLYRAYRGRVDLRFRDAELVIGLWCDLTTRTPADLPRLQSLR